MNISSQAVEIDTNIAGISESPTQLNNRDEAKKSKILLSPSMSLPCSLKLPHQRIFFIFESSLIGFGVYCIRINFSMRCIDQD